MHFEHPFLPSPAASLHRFLPSSLQSCYIWAFHNEILLSTKSKTAICIIVILRASVTTRRTVFVALEGRDIIASGRSRSREGSSEYGRNYLKEYSELHFRLFCVREELRSTGLVAWEGGIWVWRKMIHGFWGFLGMVGMRVDWTIYSRPLRRFASKVLGAGFGVGL